MNSRIKPITAQLGNLSVRASCASCSNTSISSISRTSIRWSSAKRKKREKIDPGFPEGHGENIYIFNHFITGMTVYSHKPTMKANRMLRQIPFNGKTLKPAKLRRDYWRPMAKISFPPGLGEVGRNVFQRLRECKTLHEIAWDDSVLFREKEIEVNVTPFKRRSSAEGKVVKKTGADDADSVRGDKVKVMRKEQLSKHDRGVELNNQRKNTIADIAAVLAGLGKGNKMIVKDAEAETETTATTTTAAAAAAGIIKGGNPTEQVAAQTDVEEGRQEPEQEQEPVSVTVTLPGREEPVDLIKATVFWENELDRNFAKEWTGNVSHSLLDQPWIDLMNLAEDATIDIDTDGDGKGGKQDVSSSPTAPPELVAEQELQKSTSQSQRL